MRGDFLYRQLGGEGCQASARRGRKRESTHPNRACWLRWGQRGQLFLGCHVGASHGNHGGANGKVGDNTRSASRAPRNKHFLNFFSYKYALEHLITQAKRSAINLKLN